MVEKEIRNTSSLKMAEVIHMLSGLTNGEAVVVTDVGQHQMVTSRYYQYKTHAPILPQVARVPWALHYLPPSEQSCCPGNK